MADDENRLRRLRAAPFAPWVSPSGFLAGLDLSAASQPPAGLGRAAPSLPPLGARRAKRGHPLARAALRAFGPSLGPCGTRCYPFFCLLRIQKRGPRHRPRRLRRLSKEGGRVSLGGRASPPLRLRATTRLRLAVVALRWRLPHQAAAWTGAIRPPTARRGATTRLRLAVVAPCSRSAPLLPLAGGRAAPRAWSDDQAGAATEFGNNRTLGVCHVARRSFECPSSQSDFSKPAARLTFH